MDDALPSVGMTIRFLALCEQYGSQQNAVAIIVAGRRAGVSGLSSENDWGAWNAGELRAAVKYLQERVGDRPPRRPPTVPASVGP